MGEALEYSGHIEFTINEQNMDFACSEMPIKEGIVNVYGVVSAGAILWFADVTATVLVLENRSPTKGMRGFPLAINLTANLAGNRKEGALFAKSVYVKRGKSVSIVRTTVTGSDGKLVAEITTNHVAAA